jgi:hypothetical protein
MRSMQIWNPFASFTRPGNTAAYAAGSLMANSTTAGAVVPMQFSVSGNSLPGEFRLTRIRLFKSGLSNANAQFRLHLYAAPPVPANGDGGAWSTNQAASYLGSIDVTSMKAFTDGCCDVGDDAAGAEHLVRLPGGTAFYGLLEARAAYAPAANEAFTVTLEMVEEW